MNLNALFSFPDIFGGFFVFFWVVFFIIIIFFIIVIIVIVKLLNSNVNTTRKKDKEFINPYIKSESREIENTEEKIGLNENSEIIEPEILRCAYCNQPVEKNEKFCSYCGEEIKS